MASNQTPQNYRALATGDQVGTAVFLQVGASGETLITFEQNLTYDATIARGEGFRAFKWVPLMVATYEAVVGSRCRLVGEPCAETCDANGCLCDTARQQCVDASGNSQTSSGSGSLSSGGTGDEQGAYEGAVTYSRR